MGMFLHYGDYTFVEGEPTITIDKRQTYSERGQKNVRTETVTITGELLASDKADFNSKVSALEAAFAQDAQDLILKYPDNSTVAYQLLTADTKSGTRVVGQPSYPTGDGPEFADGGRRTYNIVVEGDIDVDPDGTNAVTNFTETVSQWGGRPRYALAVTVEGTPQQFRIADSTPYFAEQTGSATGKNSWPDVAIDAVTTDGTDFVKTAEKITRVSPSNHLSDTDGTGLSHENFTINWSKSFQGITPMYQDGTDGTDLLPAVWDGSNITNPPGL